MPIAYLGVNSSHRHRGFKHGGFKMAKQLDRRILLDGTKRKKRSKPTPSAQELAKRYFDLQCLRQKVRIAESGRALGPEWTKSPPLVSFM
jgi:hypothetical protein